MSNSSTSTAVTPDMGKVLVELENLFSDRAKINFYEKVTRFLDRVGDGRISVDYIVEYGSYHLKTMVAQNATGLTDEQSYKLMGLNSETVVDSTMLHNILYNPVLSSEAVHNIVVHAFEVGLGIEVGFATRHRNVTAETLEFIFNQSPKMFINGLTTNDATPKHVLHKIVEDNFLGGAALEDIVRNRNIGSDTLELIYEKYPQNVKEVAHSWNNSPEMLEKLYFNHDSDIKNIVCSKPNAPARVFEDAYKTQGEYCLRNMAVNSGTPFHILKDMVANGAPSIAGRAVRLVWEIENPDFPEDWVENFYGVKMLPKDNHWWY